MTKNPECCLPSDMVITAAQLMKSEDVGPIPIVADKDGLKLTGIVTDRDLAIKVIAEARDPNTTRVADVMSDDVVSCRETDDVNQVLKLMEENQVRRIPVVGSNDQLLGIIAQADVATRLGQPNATGRVVEQISE
ncbi:MAG TPA: CBS domain-containing protein [Pyrinomonadaceae bacterium]|nr:CBS domain-containing protein [Pyrinomonadaceae bacterium]